MELQAIERPVEKVLKFPKERIKRLRLESPSLCYRCMKERELQALISSLFTDKEPAE
jgi:hypothetical protein